MTRPIRALIFLCGALTILAGVTPKDNTAHTRTASTKAGAPKLSDADLEKAIRAKFAKSKISADKFEVHVQGGVAHIEGKTGVLQHKGTATRLAKSAGATQVANRIVVSDEAKQKAAGNLESGRRRAQVKRGDARSEQKP
jgi:hypothetical protein